MMVARDLDGKPRFFERSRFRAKQEQLTGLLPEIRGRNLAMTILGVPGLLSDS
jgi:hypothetical protein